MYWLEFLKDRFTNKIPKGKRRHKDWSRVRKEFVEKNPECFLCKSTKKLQVHHVIPFWLAPELELDHCNLVTLCMSGKKGFKCHLLFGHLGNWQNLNLSCREDVVAWRDKLQGHQ